jgi:hypothetical protein
MSTLVKMKRQANFKDFKRFGAFKGARRTKKPCIQLVRVSTGLFDPLLPKNPTLHKNSFIINYY